MTHDGPAPEVDGYQLTECLGRGAFATVYRARHLSLRREVALKLTIAPGDPDLLRRFERELELQRDLHHPNLVRLLDGGRWHDGFFLALELVPGGSLRALRKPAGIPFPRVIELAKEIARGLEYLHARDVQHRDLKPANLLLTSEGQVKIADYGLARASTQTVITQPGTLLGTPEYIAPEIYRGQEPSKASDIYSYGVILYELVTGRTPFSASSVPDLVPLVTEGTLAPPSVFRPDIPPKLEALLIQCLARDPAARPSVPQVLEILGSSSSRSGRVSTPSGRISSGAPPARSRAPWLAVSIVVGALALSSLRFRDPGSPRAASTQAPPPASSASPLAPSLRPEEWLARIDAAWVKLRALMWKHRGAGLMRANVHSQDRAKEYEIQRAYQDLIGISADILDQAALAGEDHAWAVLSGIAVEMAMAQTYAANVSWESGIGRELLPRFRERLEPAARDSLVEAIRVSLRLHLTYDDRYFARRKPALETLISMLDRPRSTMLERIYLVECLERLILARTFTSSKRELLDGEVPEVTPLRLRQIDEVVKMKPRWPEHRLSIRVALESVAALLGDPETGVPERAHALERGSALCPLLPSRLPEDPDLAHTLGSLKDALQKRVDLRETEGLTDLAKLRECLQRLELPDRRRGGHRARADVE